MLNLFPHHHISLGVRRRQDVATQSRTNPTTLNDLNVFAQWWIDHDIERNVQEAAKNDDGKGRMCCRRSLNPAFTFVVFGCSDLI